MIAHRTPTFLEHIEVFKVVLPDNGPLKEVLKLKTYFLKLFPAMFMVFGLSYFALGVQNVVFPFLGPLGVVFDLSSEPPTPS